MSSKKIFHHPAIPAGKHSIPVWYVVVVVFSVIFGVFLSCYLNSSLFFPDDATPSLTVKNDAEKPLHVNATVTRNTADSSSVKKKPAGKTDKCAGMYIHVLHIPTQFNVDILEKCQGLSPWTNMCTLLSNSGLGPTLSSLDKTVFSGSDWFSTDQFSLELIFHNRMKQYRCLTNDSSRANAVFVPYYAGLDVGRYLWNLNATLRDETSLKFAEFISRTPEWRRFGGRDHFLVVGRITWDFRRQSENTSDYNGWGNRLLQLPVIKNMTSLLLESSPESKSEIAIPYPAFFHPFHEGEVRRWQDEMRRKNRVFLSSFAGAPRPNLKESIRNVVIKECVAVKNRNYCKFLHCKPEVTDCSKPETVMRLFQESVFCLQPPGDSYTRKSVFDTILAGCIPVFFHPGSAYVQYIWHLPKNYSSYSVFIPMDELKQGNVTHVSIEKTLLSIPKETVADMREEVIRLIPRIIYANPDEKVEGFEDGFDVTVKGVLSRVQRLKAELDRRDDDEIGSSETVPDELAWKYNFFGDLENHEWDKYFGDSFGIQ